MGKKKIKLIILIVMQLILMIGLIIYAGNRHLEQYWFDGSQLVYTDVHEEAAEYQKIYTPQLQLARGTYSIQMSYRASGEQAKLQLTDYTYASDDILANSSMELYAGEHAFHTSFKVLQAIEGFIGVIEFPGYEDVEVESVLLTRTNQDMNHIMLVLSVLFLLADGIICWYLFEKKRITVECKETLGTILVAVFFSSLPLLLHYLMNGQDLEFHLLRIEGIARGLSNGEFPVRMHPNFMGGYGYPTGIYYPEVFLYFPAVLYLLGAPLMDAYKCFLLMENIMTAVVAWYSAKIILKNNRYACLFCLLYTLLPYRMINEYYRAAVGESLAMIFLPLLIAAMYILLNRDATKTELKKAVSLLVIAVSGVLQSHVLSCEIYAIFGMIAVLVFLPVFIKPRVLCSVFKAVVWVVFLNAWFLIPFLEASKLDINVLYNTPGNITSHSLNLWQLLAFTPEASGNSKMLIKGVATEMPLYLGWAVIMCGAVAVLGFLKGYTKEKSKLKGLGIFSLVVGCGAAWMTTCLFPWNFVGNIPKIGRIMNTVQFPWRYLGVAGCLLLLAGMIALLLWDNADKKQKISVLLIGISIFTVLSLCQSMVENRNYYVVYDGAGLDSYAVIGREYLYHGTNLTELEHNSKIEEAYTLKGGTIQCEFKDLEGGCYYLPLLYYPWYEAKDAQTGEKLSVVKGDNNVAALDMPEGYSGTVIVSFAEPLLWKICTCISALSAILFILYVVCVPNKKWLFGKGKKRSNTA